MLQYLRKKREYERQIVKKYTKYSMVVCFDVQYSICDEIHGVSNQMTGCWKNIKCHSLQWCWYTFFPTYTHIFYICRDVMRYMHAFQDTQQSFCDYLSQTFLLTSSKRKAARVCSRVLHIVSYLAQTSVCEAISFCV